MRGNGLGFACALEEEHLRQDRDSLEEYTVRPEQLEYGEIPVDLAPSFSVLVPVPFGRPDLTLDARSAFVLSLFSSCASDAADCEPRLCVFSS